MSEAHLRGGRGAGATNIQTGFGSPVVMPVHAGIQAAAESAFPDVCIGSAIADCDCEGCSMSSMQRAAFVAGAARALELASSDRQAASFNPAVHLAARRGEQLAISVPTWLRGIAKRLIDRR